MKKRYKEIIFFLIIFNIFIVNVNASSYETNAAGSNGKAGTHEGCKVHRPCNNGNFVAVELRLVNYKNGSMEEISSIMLYYEKYNGNWVHKYINSKAIEYPGLKDLSYNTGFASGIKKVFTKSEVKKLFSKKYFGVDYDSIINKIKYGEYSQNRNIGSNGVKTEGIRILVIPYFTYQGYCKNSKGLCIYPATAKQMAGKTFETEDNMGVHWVAQFANYIYFEESDIGITGEKPVKETNKVFNTVKDKHSGYGWGEIGVFDDVLCNPKANKKDPCCDRISGKYTKNDQDKYYLPERYWKDKSDYKKTRVVTDNVTHDDYIKYCKNYNYCDFKKETVNCCDEITGKYKKNDQGKYYLPEKYWSDNPKYVLTRVVVDKVSHEDYIKYCFKKCNPDTEDGHCCSKVNKEDVKNGVKNNNLSRQMTLKEYENWCEKPIKTECKYSLVKDTPDTCYEKNDHGNYYEGTLGDGNDTESTWKCIFKSKDSSNKEVREHYKISYGVKNSNRYCQINCKQNIHYNFPIAGTTVEHGRFMVVEESNSYPDIWPIKYNFNKTCRTSNTNGDVGQIDYNTFKNDLIENNKNQMENWEQHRINEHILIACSNATFQHYIYDDDGNIVDSYYAGTDSTYRQPQSCGFLGSERSSTFDHYRSLSNSYLAKYKEYKAERSTIIKEINYCSTFDGEEKEFSMDLNMNYEEPIYGGKYNLNESKDPKYKTSSSNLKYYQGGNSIDSTGTANSSIPTSQIILNDCEVENYCEKRTAYTYNSPTWVEKIYDKNNQYELDKDLYKYVSKYSGMSYTSSSKYSNNDLEIERPNLPVHFSTEAGPYDYAIYILDINSSNKFYPYFFGSNTFAGKSYNINRYRYNCEYNVKGTTPNPDVGPIIFRPISLATSDDKKHSLAFLTKNGNYRTPGTNWNSDYYIDKFITNNRDTAGANVYHKPPLYEVTLTPNLMNTIKKYNSTLNNELATIYNGKVKERYGVLGYTNTDELQCDENGANCISTVMRENWGVSGCVIKGNCPDKCNIDGSC